MFIRRHYSSYNSRSCTPGREIRDITINSMFKPFRILSDFIPILAILNLCNVTNISWSVLAISFVGYILIDYFSDILEILIYQNDMKKDEERWKKEEAERLKHFKEG